MTKEEAQNISFQIIGYAGDALSDFVEAVAQAKKGNGEEAQKLMQAGKEQLTKAHKSQTDLLVAEANNEELPFSIILVHAQDHIMNAILYENIAKDFIELYLERSSNNEK